MKDEEYAYTVVYSQAGKNWSAHAPDVPGCIATGSTREECEANFKRALEIWIEETLQRNLPVPMPSTYSEQVRVKIANR